MANNRNRRYHKSHPNAFTKNSKYDSPENTRNHSTYDDTQKSKERDTNEQYKPTKASKENKDNTIIIQKNNNKTQNPSQQQIDQKYILKSEEQSQNNTNNASKNELDRVTQDVQRVIDETIKALKANDSRGIENISNTVIHNASVFQDEKTIEIAIAIYALSKIAKHQPQLNDQFAGLLVHLGELFKNKQYHAYSRSIKHLLEKITEVDDQTSDYASHVISRAKIQKGTGLYYHGISLGQSACALGISQWELYSFVGKTKHDDDDDDETASVKNTYLRLQYARGLLKQKNNILVFDAGPIITSTMNGLLFALPRLKETFNADFLIPQAVYNELIEKPMQTRRHKLEAYHVIEHINNNTIHTIDKKHLLSQTQMYLDIINTAYKAFGNPIKIIHEGEMQALVLAKSLGARTVVVDERTTRYLLETPIRVVQRFERKLHTQITVDTEKVQKFHDAFSHIQPLRSVELYTIALEQGLFNELIEGMPAKNNEKQFYEGLLWGLKLAGCGISQKEIYALLDKLKIS
jgi:predicted nucleic acid-binding protein